MVQRRTIILTIVVIAFFGLVDAAWLPNSRIVMDHDNYVELAKAGLLLTFGFLAAKMTTVSYTHLTLPTIYSV